MRTALISYHLWVWILISLVIEFSYPFRFGFSFAKALRSFILKLKPDILGRSRSQIRGTDWADWCFYVEKVGPDIWIVIQVKSSVSCWPPIPCPNCSNAPFYFFGKPMENTPGWTFSIKPSMYYHFLSNHPFIIASPTEHCSKVAGLLQ